MQVTFAINMAINQSLDLTKIPLSALKPSTLVTLSASLNPQKIIPTCNGLPRDWRGFAQLMGLNVMETNQISAKSDHFHALIECWGAKGNLSLLQTYLGDIDRYDVLDDVKEALVKDSLEYMERLDKIKSPVINYNAEAERKILTRDDVIRLEKGLEPQIYDAYILYADEDIDFASELIETMERKYNLKLCVRDRDLIGGLLFEREAIAKLVAERCRRLVVVVSSNLLKSKANKFILTFAQSLGVDISERKVIPILYESCEVPPELSYYFLLDYNRAGKLWNFWDKLRDSIQSLEISQSIPNETTKDDSTVKLKNDLWISRTRFEGERKELEPKQSEIVSSPSETSVTEKKDKMGNIYRIIKSGFNKAKRNQNGREPGPESPEGVCPVDDYAVIRNKDVPVEKIEDSSGSKSKCKDPSEIETNKKTKKKWYKKKPVKISLFLKESL